MKNALLIGCGKNKGSAITECLLNNNYNIDNIGSSAHPKANNIVIDWKTLDIASMYKLLPKKQKYDFIFFNQNSSSLTETDFTILENKTLDTLSLIKSWSHSQWISCQLPFLILHSIKLSSEAKVGWMLSSYIKHTMVGSIDHPDYSSFKYLNYLQMKCFGNKNSIKTFGIYPDFKFDNSPNILYNVIQEIINDDSKHKDYYFKEYK